MSFNYSKRLCYGVPLYANNDTILEKKKKLGLYGFRSSCVTISQWAQPINR